MLKRIIESLKALNKIILDELYQAGRITIGGERNENNNDVSHR
jgi:hypothetical protein